MELQGIHITRLPDGDLHMSVPMNYAGPHNDTWMTAFFGTWWKWRAAWRKEQRDSIKP